MTLAPDTGEKLVSVFWHNLDTGDTAYIIEDISVIEGPFEVLNTDNRTLLTLEGETRTHLPETVAITFSSLLVKKAMKEHKKKLRQAVLEQGLPLRFGFQIQDNFLFMHVAPYLGNCYLKHPECLCAIPVGADPEDDVTYETAFRVVIERIIAAQELEETAIPQSLPSVPAGL